MALKFVNSKTAKLTLDVAPTEGSKTPILIFGDEVETIGQPSDGVQKVSWRGRRGQMKASLLGTQRSLELYFIDVGTGDSTFIVTPGGKRILVDGGLNRRARGFLAWKYRLNETEEPVEIDLLVLSHADDDHLLGLTEVICHPKIRVKRIIHSGIAKYAAQQFNTVLGETEQSGGTTYLTTRHDRLPDPDSPPLSASFKAWISAIKRLRIPYGAVASSMTPLSVGDPCISIDVLGPRLVPHPSSPGDQAFVYFGGSDSKAINGNSVVLRLRFQEFAVLLPGDINQPAAVHLLDDPATRSRLSAHVLKAAHHGSEDFAPRFLEFVRPQLTVISSGDDRDHGHPRAKYVGAVGRASRGSEPLIFSTEIAGRFVEETSARKAAGKLPMPGPEDDPTVPTTDEDHRRLFKRALHGMINVRSNGTELYAARRVSASYQWEAYGEVALAP